MHRAPLSPLRATYVRHAIVAIALLTCMGPALPGRAQSGRKLPPQNSVQTPTSTQNPDNGDIQLGTQEVLLSITVRDAFGHPVTGLSQDDFIVAEDRVRQKIVSCAIASQPVNVVLLLDASGSVFSELASIRKAADSFVRALSPEDKIAVVQFAQKVELLQAWTTDREAIEHAIDWRYKGGDATSFWDAIYLAADQLFAGIDGPKAIVILSDGVDTSSKVTEEQTVAALDRSGSSVFVVSKAQVLIDQVRKYTGVGGVMTGSAGQARYALQRLEDAQAEMGKLADRYGGVMLLPRDSDDLGPQFAAIAKELKQQYLVTYVPENEERDGRWRSVSIFLTRPGLTARTRKGYIAE